MARIKPKLHPFEFIGAYKLYEEERFLLADEMGMFKTAQSIFANNKFREKHRRKPGKMRTLIVCPTAVKEHWARELVKWSYPSTNINLTQASSITSNIYSAKSSSHTIMTYPTISRLDESMIKRLIRTGFHHIILDEAHNAKNPHAIRTKFTKTLADKCDYLSLLSGTPIPNTISDLYTTMSLLDPVEYKLDPENLQSARQSFIQLYSNHPQIIKELLHRKMLRREAKDYLKEHIPELKVHKVELPLKGAHLDEYCKILEQDINPGKKIMLLEKASIDPLLINDSLPRMYRGKNTSVKYEFLDKIIEREMRKRKGKVLVFSNLKRGIIDNLIERYQDFGAIKITGDIPTEGGIRENLRQQFQYDPKTKVIIATTTMNEGVDLTAATAVVDLTIPWTPAEYHQKYKRSQRPGEIIKDTVDLYVPYTTIPGSQESIEQASLAMLEGKERVVKYLTSGIQLSLEELKELGEPTKVPRIVKSITSPNKAIFQYFLKWRGIGTKRASKKLEDEGMAKYIAELYPTFNMTKNASKIYLPIIKRLERRRKLTPKVDIACGPGSLGHSLDEVTYGIDINCEMLKVGREFYDKNRLIQGSMSDLPLPDKFAGLTLCSLAFQMSNPRKERAKALYEMSRILKPRGYSIITIPYNYLDSNDERRFKQVLNVYGLEIKEHRKEIGPSKIDLYVMQKVRQPKDKIYSLKFKGDPRNT